MRTLAAEFTDDDTDHVGKVLIISNIAFKMNCWDGKGCPVSFVDHFGPVATQPLCIQSPNLSKTLRT
jgi:hypothetical protein